MELTTKNLILRSPEMAHLSSLELFLERNKNHLAHWETFSEKPASDQLEGSIKDMQEGRSVRFFIFPKDNPKLLIGMCNFTQVFRGGFQACYLGYKIDGEYEGKGYMHEALKESIKYIFEVEKLHRIMSNFIPKNHRSAAVLLRLGFSIEGYAKNYLKINDKWQDHILTSLTYERWTSTDFTGAKTNLNEIIDKLKRWAEPLS